MWPLVKQVFPPETKESLDFQVLLPGPEGERASARPARLGTRARAGQLSALPLASDFRGQSSRFHLRCLPSSDQLSDEDTQKSAACKKMVTFDLSNSEDTDSTSSVNLHQPSCKCRPGLVRCARG